MIKNERQYRITKAQVEKFTRTLDELNTSTLEHKDVHPILLKAEQDALRSQLNDLLQEIKEYEALESGEYPITTLDSLIELPIMLIKARIAKRLTQKELAEQLGIKEQQIQKYEATEYASASLTRIQEVIEALGISTTKKTKIGSMIVTPDYLFDRLGEVGYDRSFIEKRLIPAKLEASFNTKNIQRNKNLVYQAATYIGRVLNWSPEKILGNDELTLEAEPVFAKFKVPVRVKERQFKAYVIYAHYLALTMLQAARTKSQNNIPTSPYETREKILSTYGELTLENVLNYVWDLGIPVLPLKDSGTFHGACFREQGRNIIVVKQKTSSQARWLFDIFHEIWHASQEPSKSDRTVIEDDEMSPHRLSSDEEKIASQYAGAVLLGQNPQNLAELCLNEANHDIKMLKSAVQRVAVKKDISVDSLANYMAFRLSLEGENWWSTAANLQKTDVNPWLIARDILLENIELSKLSEPDFLLFQRALTG